MSLARTAAEGLSVPPAAVLAVPQELVPKEIPSTWEAGLPSAIEALNQASGRKAPRLAVRSSPTISMPGMLDTVLDVPADLHAVKDAITHVIGSWWSERASAYRAKRSIGAEAGLAVVVQAMVDGKRDSASGTGVGFTRDPRSGEPEPVIEYAAQARGDEVVGGRLTPLRGTEFRQRHPDVWEQIATWLARLEAIFRDAQEFEFTVESGRAFLLQSRPAKRSVAAQVRIAHDLSTAGVITDAEAAEAIAGIDLDRLVAPRLATDGIQPIATARVAAPGAAAGRIVLRRDRVHVLREEGPVILVTDTTDPADYPVMHELAGVLTRLGGVTSHAAVAALEAGIVALVGCDKLEVDATTRAMRIADLLLHEGDWISIQGDGRGEVYAGHLAQTDALLPRGVTPGSLRWARALQREAGG